MDWLFAWWIFGGSRRTQHVLIETTEERAARERREAEAWHDMAAGLGRFFGNPIVQVILGVALLWNCPSFISLLISP